MLINQLSTNQTHRQADPRDGVVAGVEKVLQFLGVVLWPKECALGQSVSHAKCGTAPGIEFRLEVTWPHGAPHHDAIVKVRDVTPLSNLINYLVGGSLKVLITTSLNATSANNRVRSDRY